MSTMITASAGGLSVTRADAGDARAWDEFAERQPEVRFCHLWGYKAVLEGVFGYRCVYLNFHVKGQRVGIFPSIVARRAGGWLVSQPFNEYGGPLLEGVCPEQWSELPSQLLRTAREEGCRGIEIRGGIGSEALASSPSCLKSDLHSYAVVDLRVDREVLWRRTITHEARKGVKRAQSSGLKVEICSGSAAVEDPFYHLYLLSMKRLGVPPQSRQFFVRLAEAMQERLVAARVLHQENTVAMLLGVIAGRRIQLYVTSSSPESWSMRPNDLAHWELLCWAQSNGVTAADFGSARYEGQVRFKKKWGAAFYAYGFYCLTAEPNTQADAKMFAVKTSSTPMRTMARIWQTTVPLSLTRVVGPPIRKYLTK